MKFSCILLFLLLGAGSSLQAMGTPSSDGASTDPIVALTPLTLEHALNEAFQHNPGWEGARLSSQQAREDIQILSGWADPKVRIVQALESVETRLGPQERSATVSQRLPYWGESSLAADAAEAGVRIADRRTESYRQNLRNQVKLVFYEIWELQRSLEALRQNQILVQQLATIGTTGLSGSVGSLRSVLKAQAQIGQSAYDFLVVQDKLHSATARLNALLGRQSSGEIRNPLLVSEPPLPSLPESLESQIELALANNPELQAIKESISRDRYLAEFAQAGARFPSIEISYTLVQIGEALNPDLKDSGKDASNIGIGFNLPWGNSKRSAKQEKASLELRRSELDLVNRINLMRESVTEAYYKALNAQRLETLFAETLLPQAVRTLSIAERMTRTSNESPMAALEARNVLLNFQISSFRARSDLLKALAMLDVLTGQAESPAPIQ